MSRAESLKASAQEAAEEAAFVKLQAAVEKAQTELDAAMTMLPRLIASAIERAIDQAVLPYQSLLAQQEKDALTADHPGWGDRFNDANRLPGALV